MMLNQEIHGDLSCRQTHYRVRYLAAAFRTTSYGQMKLLMQMNEFLSCVFQMMFCEI